MDMANEEVYADKVEELKKEIAELREQLKQYTEAADVEERDSLRELKRKLGWKSGDLMHELTPIIEKYKESGREAVYKVEDKIIEKPLQSLVFALVGGIVLGKLLGRCGCRR